MEYLPDIFLIIVAMAILAGFIPILKPFFKKKDRYRDSVSSSRNQNELINKK